MIPITEKLLSGAGGWQALKAGRELWKAGRVSGAAYEPPLLAGEVREGKTYRAGLRIRTATDVENICTCRESRQWGKVCAHSLAVGLAYLAPTPVAPNEPVLVTGAGSRFAQPNDLGAQLVSLHFILPPNFPAAWSKGEIMICIETGHDGRRLMLDALPDGQRFRLTEQDEAVLEQLVFSLGAQPAGMNLLPAAAFLRLLPAFRGHDRITFGRSPSARVSRELYRPEITVDRAGTDRFQIAAKNREAFLVAGSEAWALLETEFREIGSNLPLRLTSALQEPLSLRSEAALEFFALELPAWQEAAEISLPAGMAFPATAYAQPAFSLKIEGSLQQLRAALLCRYGERPPFPPLAGPEQTFVLRDQTDKNLLLLRNLKLENAAVARIEAAGFAGNAGRFELRDPARAARFFAFEFPALAQEWNVSVAPQLKKTRDAFEPATPAIDIVRSGEDWFELKFAVTTSDGEHIPLPEIQRLLRGGQNRLQLKSGRQAVFDPVALEDFEQLLRDADPRQHQPGVYRLDKIQTAYLTNTAAEIGARLVDVAQALSAPANPALELGALGKKLRDYQRTGVAWLAALAGQKLGGILADEMGLGKTVQALAFLQLRQGNGPALIVCPTSLLANWQREAARFTPGLRALVIDGTNRAEKIARLPEFDLGLTSYGLLRRDAALYAPLLFDSVVLDEAQHIKNPETQNAQAAFNLRSRQRFVLTGTPMENSVRDLWSLMNFVAPNYLGSRSDFRERYEKLLARGPEPVLQRRLARRIRPFLLRRRKVDVAKELPAKIEQVIPCDLGPAQREVYDALLREIQLGLGSGANDGASRMKMLTGLLRMRQACCDLRLLGLEKGDSAKLDLLDELLEESIDGGHRVLLFSQFVQMLALVRQRLQASGTAFCYLAGQTINRQEEVDRFQNDGTIPVFLISLKAGGVGLNLSAADTVIHFDPWWNAAVEAQATDRAHRIGQTRVVTAYKLIARATVEEKILRLQERKRELAGAMVENEEPLMSGLTTADLEELLAR